MSPAAHEVIRRLDAARQKWWLYTLLTTAVLATCVSLGTLFLFMLTDALLKFSQLALLGLFNAGWYSILKAQLYSSLPGRSGTVMAIDNIFGLVGALIPWGLGLIAQCFDLRVTMWLLLFGPVALLIGLPRKTQADGG